MKITFGASSIVSLACFFLLAGCESIESVHIPHLWADDEVPEEIKDQPRFVEVPMTEEDEKSWPRLGDVPFKPKDFSPPAAYRNSMNELNRDRTDAETARQSVLSENPAAINAASQDNNTQELPVILPPQFLKK